MDLDQRSRELSPMLSGLRVHGEILHCWKEAVIELLRTALESNQLQSDLPKQPLESLLTQQPRSFAAEFVASVEDGISKVEVFIDGERLGAKLNDNSYVSDGYRFHDIFHMTCAALLGWSPVVRALMKRKRKSDKETDDVENGGRAIVTDEALAAVVFSYAIRHKYLDEIKVLDWQLLDLCHDLTETFEVGRRSRYEWEQTILKTFEIWRKV